MHRRKFLKMSSAGVFVATLPQLPDLTRYAKYRTALIGTGWWGMNILREAIAAGQSKIAAICDVDEQYLQAAAAEINKLNGDRPKSYSDYRELLQKEKPEIVIVATPDHWHPLITIAALESGAHVYVEKPVGHTINEGKAMVKAARATDLVVQVGTHRRVSPHNMSGMQFLKSGKAGKIGMVRAFVHYGGGAGKPVPDSEPPAGLDWNAWCGPAPLRPYNSAIHPRGFRQFLDFANGQLGDWGIHWMDQILWWTEEKGPRKIFSSAARRIRTDNTDAPDTQIVNYEFESFNAVWEHRLYAANEAEKTNVGCYFYGTEGTFHMGWLDGWTFYPANKNKPVIHENPQLHTGDNHNVKELWADFLDSIATKRRPVCDIETGHRSTNMSLLGMLSQKAGRSIVWDPEKELISGDQDAARFLQREYRPPWIYPA
ncbi:Gfo/Idh/MocA family protein [Flavihumibacter stibioxidans]|uniref:Oxidoreductase n=1 Tax=Flavihumibacter stibioxidans TaxID=1834163 RepID=A0ABR7M416_9BACT|nr:Gfo/Idh/MocA family oxidoreductase [Flavihumibacter stibioxidans]MBC6489769.1 oxidoreductase [Flavihumibacter stibioxidans]